MAATLLGDDQWLDDKFFPENIKRLSEAYSHTVDTLGEIGIKAFRAKVKVKMRSFFSDFYNFRLDSLCGWISGNI